MRKGEFLPTYAHVVRIINDLDEPTNLSIVVPDIFVCALSSSA